MSFGTQQALLVMGDDVSGNEDSDQDYIDVEIDGASTKKPPRKAKPVVRRTYNKGFSLSQPAAPARKRKCESPERFASDSQLEPKAFMKVLNTIQRDVKAMRDLVKKELPAIKTSVEELKSELSEVKAKIAAVAPPVNIENNLSELSNKVDLLSGRLNTASNLGIQQENKMKLADVIDDVERKIKQRKMKFYDFHSYSERHAIYSSWEQLETPFVMAKYLPVLIENEPEEEYNARRRKAENNRICDMELYALRAQRAKKTTDAIDAEVAENIQSLDVSDDTKKSLHEEWVNLVKCEEDKSRKMWEKTAKNLLETPLRERDTNKVVEKEGKTYAAAVKAKPKKNSNGNGNSEEQMQVDPPSEDQEWTSVNGRNKRSHKPEQQSAAQPSKTPSKQQESHQPNSTFRKKGPKFKPKNRERRGWYQNQWGYRNHQNWW